MTTEDKPIISFNTAVRAAYANIDKAHKFKKNGVETGEPRYDASFLVAPNDKDLAALKAEVSAMLKAKHPGQKIVPRRLTQEEVDSGNVVEVHVPWYAGEKEAKRIVAKAKPGKEAEAAKRAEIFNGQVLVKAASKFQPNLSAFINKQVVDFVTEEAKAANGKKYFYPGSYLVPSFKLHYYAPDGDKPGGVSLYLDAVLFIKDGEKLAGGAGKSAAETFKNYLGSVSAEDPTAGAVDELEEDTGAL